jgi:hypothetical protein
MENKLEKVKKELSQSFPHAKIEYRSSDDLHKFQLEFAHYTQWLYIGSETVEDSSDTELINLLNNYQVVKNFKDNPHSKDILLTKQGANESTI